MENQYALMAMGFVNALSPMNIVIMIASVTMGIIIGCMPGLSAAMGVALLLPLALGQEGIYYAEVGAWTAAAILLVAAYYARMRALSRRKGFALDEKN